ncbi:MAG: ComF family protein [Clostridia bacterium]|nr:ComF family protein [Clostridia bacterium]
MKLKNFFFPTTCVVCGAITENTTSHICNSCYKALPFRKGFSFCIPTKNDGFRHCSGVLCPLYYYGEVPRLISSLKFSGHREAGVVLGKILAQQVRRCGFLGRGNDVVLIPIPLHRDRERRRGYNQAEVIAKTVSDITGIPMEAQWLLRSVNTLPQHHNNRAQRLLMEAGFVASRQVRGRTVVLVDDVITTGATLESAAEVLLKNGAKAVFYAAAAGNLPLIPE